MSHKNLIVLINAAPSDIIKKEFPNHHVYTDANIFSIFNGNEYFFSKPYTNDDIKEFCESIEEHSKKFKILIHTFNPLLINFLEAYGPDENGKDDFSMSLSEDRFLAYNKNNEFIKILQVPDFAEKIGFMTVGEAFSDSIIRTYL
jgi:hypothetical protein